MQIVLVLREDGDTVPEAVSKWADESNWMGGDAVVLSADTAEVGSLVAQLLSWLDGWLTDY